MKAFESVLLSVFISGKVLVCPPTTRHDGTRNTPTGRTRGRHPTTFWLKRMSVFLPAQRPDGRSIWPEAREDIRCGSPRLRGRVGSWVFPVSGQPLRRQTPDLPAG